MFSPTKVARTQRSCEILDRSGDAAPGAERSGMGRRRCWIVDETLKVVRVWSYEQLSSRGCGAPALVDVPLPLLTSAAGSVFVSETCDDSDCLAFCSPTGEVATSDRSVAFQILDATNASSTVSSFACVRRADYQQAVVTVLGTTDGFVVVDIKRRGAHSTREILLGGEATAAQLPEGKQRWWASVASLMRGDGASHSASTQATNQATGVRALTLRRTRRLEVLALAGDAVHSLEITLEKGGVTLQQRWTCLLSDALERRSEALGLGECEGKICVLVAATNSLFLATLDDHNGRLLHATSLNTVLSVVELAKSSPSHHINIFPDASRPDVLVCLGNVVMCVNTCVDVRSPCASEHTVFLRHLPGSVTSVLLSNGAVAALDGRGPHIAMESVFTADGGIHLLDTSESAASCAFQGPLDAQLARDAELCVDRLIDICRIDPKTTLDDAVLAASESFFAAEEAVGGSWALREGQEDTGNIILRATAKLKRSQQSHRRFLVAVLKKPQIVRALRPDTLGQLISAQECLLVVLSLRALQNVGFLPGSDFTAFSTVETTLPSGRHNAGMPVPATLPLVQHQSHLSQCQALLRRAVNQITELHRASSSIKFAFANPQNCVELLCSVLDYLNEARRSAVLERESKHRVAYAAACILLESIATVLALSRDIHPHLWTNGKQAIWSNIQQLISGTSADQRDLLELVHFLLFFSMSCHLTAEDPLYHSSLLRSTLLGKPFTRGAFGYPFGRPVPGGGCGAGVALRALEASEGLAIAFDIFDVLSDFSLADPVEDPTDASVAYALFAEYCTLRPAFFSFALSRLLQQQREWELLCLPSAIQAAVPHATTERNRFLERHAPHLLWIAAPERFDALIREAGASKPAVPYGPRLLSHKSRCIALARLSHLAAGSPPSLYSGELELGALIRVQKKHLSPAADGASLGPQELVQRLLAMENNVDAWIDAATIAVLSREEVARDLLVQVLRQCKSYDGPSLLACFRDEFGELECTRRMNQTACGALLRACCPLQSVTTLRSLGDTVFTNEELQLLCSAGHGLGRGAGRPYHHGMAIRRTEGTTKSRLSFGCTQRSFRLCNFDEIAKRLFVGRLFCCLLLFLYPLLMNTLKASSLLFQLIQWKKRQAALLFAAWDAEDEGCIPVLHLRPLLRSLFPPPMEASKGQSVEAQRRLADRHREALSPARIRVALRHCTRRDLWGGYQGLTLRDVQAVVDWLCRYDFIQLEEAAALSRAGTLQDPDAAMEHDLFGCPIEAEPTSMEAPTILLHDCCAFALLLGELERVYMECTHAAQCGATASIPGFAPGSSLRAGPADLQCVAAEVLGTPLTYHEAKAMSAFLCAAFEPQSVGLPILLHKTHFLASLLTHRSLGLIAQLQKQSTSHFSLRIKFNFIRLELREAVNVRLVERPQTFEVHKLDQITFSEGLIRLYWQPMAVNCYSDAFEGSTTDTMSEAASVAIHRHILRLFRQLATKQQKQRQAIVAEEQHDFEDLLRHHEMQETSIAAFLAYREQREREQERKLRYASLWTNWSTAEHLVHLVEREEGSRYHLEQRESRLRQTLQKLSKMEEAPLLWRHALDMVVFGEMVRRVAFYRQELEEAMSMNIPGYHPELLTVEGISDKKVDWMKNVCCPFRFADDCPFFPTRVPHTVQDASLFLAPPQLVGCKGGTDGGAVVAAPCDHRSTAHPHPPASGAALPPLSRANQIAIRSALNQGHYRKSKCSFLPPSPFTLMPLPSDTVDAAADWSASASHHPAEVDTFLAEVARMERCIELQQRELRVLMKERQLLERTAARLSRDVNHLFATHARLDGIQRLTESSCLVLEGKRQTVSQVNLLIAKQKQMQLLTSQRALCSSESALSAHLSPDPSLVLWQAALTDSPAAHTGKMRDGSQISVSSPSHREESRTAEQNVRRPHSNRGVACCFYLLPHHFTSNSQTKCSVPSTRHFDKIKMSCISKTATTCIIGIVFLFELVASKQYLLESQESVISIKKSNIFEELVPHPAQGKVFCHRRQLFLFICGDCEEVRPMTSPLEMRERGVAPLNHSPFSCYPAAPFESPMYQSRTHCSTVYSSQLPSVEAESAHGLTSTTLSEEWGTAPTHASPRHNPLQRIQDTSTRTTETLCDTSTNPDADPLCGSDSASSSTTLFPAVFGSTRCQSTSCTASPLSIKTPSDAAGRGMNRWGVAHISDPSFEEELTAKVEAPGSTRGVDAATECRDAWLSELVIMRHDTFGSHRSQLDSGSAEHPVPCEPLIDVFLKKTDGNQHWCAQKTVPQPPSPIVPLDFTPGAQDPNSSASNTAASHPLSSPKLSPLAKLVARLPLTKEELDEMERRERESRTGVLSRHNLRAHQQHLRQGGLTHFHRSSGSIGHGHERSATGPHRMLRATAGTLNDVLHECRFLGMDDVVASVSNLSPNELMGTHRPDGTEASQDTTEGSQGGQEPSHHTSCAASPGSSCRFSANPQASQVSSYITPGRALYLAAAMTEKSLMESECGAGRSPELFTAWHDGLGFCRRDSSVYNNSMIMSPLSVEEGSPLRQRFCRIKSQSSTMHTELFDPLEHKVCNSERVFPGSVVSSNSAAVLAPRNSMSPPTVVCGSADSGIRHPSLTRDGSSCCSTLRGKASVDIVFTLARDSNIVPPMRCQDFRDETHAVKDLIKWAGKAAEAEPVLSTDTELTSYECQTLRKYCLPSLFYPTFFVLLVSVLGAVLLKTKTGNQNRESVYPSTFTYRLFDPRRTFSLEMEQRDTIRRLCSEFPSFSLSDARALLEGAGWNYAAARKAAEAEERRRAAGGRNENRFYAGDGQMTTMPGTEKPEEDPKHCFINFLRKLVQEPRVFFGEGRRLGHTENPSPPMASTLRQQRDSVLEVYQNGFLLENGEFIPLDSPQGKEGCTEMNKGFVPPFLLKLFPNTDLTITLHDKSSLVYEPPAFVSFGGEGHRLTTAPQPAASEAIASNPFVFNESEPSSTLMLVSSKGERKEVKVNPERHTVGDIYGLARQLEGSTSPFTLVVRERPPRKLDVALQKQTVGEAKLTRAVIAVQK
eukprot:gene10234-7173_t